MQNSELFELIKTTVPEERILREEPMARHTTFRIGGPADFFVTVNNSAELSELIKKFRSKGVPYFLIGNGSNFLVSDDGYRGVVIKLGGEFEEIHVSGTTITAGAAALLSKVSAVATEHGLTGMEFASGIPGSVGGAMFMNAGAYGGEMKDIVKTVVCMSADGLFSRMLRNSDMEFGYRHSALEENGNIVKTVKFSLEQGDEETVREKVMHLTKKRNEKQPVEFPSAGSTFKRPQDGYAAAMIEEAGLKGLKVGGAQVSDKHTGFIINTGGASCKDVLELMRKVVEAVYEDSGTTLEPEIRILGEKL